MQCNASDSDSLMKIKWSIYKDSNDRKLKVGMTFKDHQECNQEKTKHSCKDGRMVSFKLSDKRVKIVCKAPCPYYVLSS